MPMQAFPYTHTVLINVCVLRLDDFVKNFLMFLILNNPTIFETFFWTCYILTIIILNICIWLCTFSSYTQFAPTDQKIRLQNLLKCQSVRTTSSSDVGSITYGYPSLNLDLYLQCFATRVSKIWGFRSQIPRLGNALNGTSLPLKWRS